MNVPGAVPGSVPLGGLIPGRGSQDGMSEEQKYEQRMVRWTQVAFESCPTKCVMSGVIGAGLGGMIGLFMSSMRYDTPLTLPNQTPISHLPLRQQLSHGLRDMGRSSLSSARNFGLVGAIFSGTECCIEGLRAKNDLGNGVAAGCITGAGLAAKAGGPGGAAVGCVGFAAFSAAIDSWMRMEEREEGARID